MSFLMASLCMKDDHCLKEKLSTKEVIELLQNVLFDGFTLYERRSLFKGEVIYKGSYRASPKCPSKMNFAATFDTCNKFIDQVFCVLKQCGCGFVPF